MESFIILSLLVLLILIFTIINQISYIRDSLRKIEKQLSKQAPETNSVNVAVNPITTPVTTPVIDPIFAATSHQAQPTIDWKPWEPIYSPPAPQEKPAIIAETVLENFSESRPIAPRHIPTTQTKTAEITAEETAENIPPVAPIFSAKPTTQPTVTFSEKLEEWLKNGNLIARFGIGILLLGGVFLVQQVTEMGLFPIEYRLLALACMALGLLGFGWKVRESHPQHSFVLQGGGIAAFYLTVFASGRIFEVLSMTGSLSIMILVAILSGMLAVIQNARSLIMIATLAGFLAPILMSSNSGNFVGLFSYYAALNIGIFVAAWWRSWNWLNSVGVFFTFGIYTFWRGVSYEPENLTLGVFFILLFFVMYVAISVRMAWRDSQRNINNINNKLNNMVSGTLVFGLPMAAFGLLISMIQVIEYGAAWSSLGFGCFYLLLAYALFNYARESMSVLIMAFAGLGITFASLAIPLAWSARASAVLWTVEAAGLIWLGLRQAQLLPRAFGFILQALAMFSFFIGLNNLESKTPGLEGVLLALSLLWSAYFIRNNTIKKSQKLFEIEVFFGNSSPYLAFLFLGFGALAEIHSQTRFNTYGLWLLFIGSSAGLYGALGKIWRWSDISKFGLFISSFFGIILVLFLFILPILPKFVLLLWLPIWLIQYGQTYHWEKTNDIKKSPIISVDFLAYFNVILVIFPILHEIIVWTNMNMLDTWKYVIWAFFAMGLVYVFHNIILQKISHWFIQNHANIYRQYTHLNLMILVIFMILLNIFSHGNAEPILYLPILNPIDLVSLLILCLVGLHQKQIINFLNIKSHQFQLGWGLLAFLFTNSAIIRGWHWLGNTPFFFQEGFTHAMPVQVSLTLFWSVLGVFLMFWGSKKMRRHLWAIGGILLVIVVLKIFTIDLTRAGKIARILSFLGVGILCLIAAFIAPLPNKIQNKTKDKPEDKPEDLQNNLNNSEN